VAVGIVPGKIDPQNEDGMVSFLADLFDMSEDAIRQKYAYAQADWYVAIGDVSAAVAQENSDRFARYPGIILSPFRARYYYDEGIAPHVTGYVLSISPENLEEYQRKGYRGDEKVGATGLEAWGENYLAGKHGASLYVKDPQGQVVTKLASAPAEPADSI
jgi:penicillin-binding protein 2